MHFIKALDPTCLCAEMFIDKDFNPIQRKYTVKGKPLMEKTPGSSKERLAVRFQETDKKAFFANSQIKAIGRMLRRSDTDDWEGAQLTITSHEVNAIGGGTTLGMKVAHAAFVQQPREQRPAQAKQKPALPLGSPEDEERKAIEGS